ncbi:pentatricopeptide repeat-containing protein At2g20710, mitochondrial-like [Salvia miltiorrhiza]|uniref:pentatricopeptide repeat-containing protein At2g20710, mitochondrial-like n=1 Tax=Salvia miltiorrhiza TaxID=226208 RepID=UPI0025AD5772|nr:pentatricopeptide repeat-containing protein At2g20710, mitochondrial-like [Salvia miltiorrhiza]
MKRLMKSVRSWRLEPSICSVSLYSTQTQTTSAPRLFKRLQRCNQERASVLPVLDEWVAQGRRMHRPELERFIKSFRTNNRIKPALEIAEWMTRSLEHFTLNPAHVAIQLDLISKVRGVEQAEHFFNGLEDGLKDPRVYSALLNCYADAKSLEKAEATMEKIRELNYRSNLSYNTMMSLYSKMGMHDKVDLMMQEMESEGIDFSIVTYNIRLNIYADHSDLEGMEKLLMKMEADPLVSDKFCSYCIAAKGYIKAGALEKALAIVKKAELLIKGRERRFAYGPLMGLYGTMQKREEVYRVWNLLRKCGKLQYGSYAYVIPTLEKLDDLDGAKKILEEWEEENAGGSDIRVPNLVIGAYCRKGDVGEADVILKRVAEGGRKPCSKTWSHMALGYLKNGRMEEAVEMTKKASMAAVSGWKPDHATVAACVEHLKKKGEGKEAQELLVLLEKHAISWDLSENMKI